MKNNKHGKAIETLLIEYKRLGGNLFSDFYMRNRATDEQKKSIEANDFLMGMINGKLNLKKEYSIEETEDYKNLQSIVESINFLAKDNEKNSD